MTYWLIDSWTICNSRRRINFIIKKLCLHMRVTQRLPLSSPIPSTYTSAVCLYAKYIYLSNSRLINLFFSLFTQPFRHPSIYPYLSIYLFMFLLRLSVQKLRSFDWTILTKCCGPCLVQRYGLSGFLHLSLNHDDTVIRDVTVSRCERSSAIKHLRKLTILHLRCVDLSLTRSEIPNPICWLLDDDVSTRCDAGIALKIVLGSTNSRWWILTTQWIAPSRWSTTNVADSDDEVIQALIC